MVAGILFNPRSQYHHFIYLQLIAPYGVTKTALLGLTKALAASLADENIRVNCIAPGVIKTKFSGLVRACSFYNSW